MSKAFVNIPIGNVEVDYSYSPRDPEVGYFTDEFDIEKVSLDDLDITELLSEKCLELIEGEIRNG